jgi:hypothetical protein
MTLRDRILSTSDIPEEQVHVKEWDCDLLMRGMSAGERLALTSSAYDQDTGRVDMTLVFPDLIIACAFDPANPQDKVFSPDDRSALLAKSSAAVEFLAGHAMRLSGIGKDVQDAAGKDSSASLSDDSSSNSPSD